MSEAGPDNERQWQVSFAPIFYSTRTKTLIFKSCRIKTKRSRVMRCVCFPALPPLARFSAHVIGNEYFYASRVLCIFTHLTPITRFFRTTSARFPVLGAGYIFPAHGSRQAGNILLDLNCDWFIELSAFIVIGLMIRLRVLKKKKKHVSAAQPIDRK